jgi:hypothetical protein
MDAMDLIDMRASGRLESSSCGMVVDEIQG